MKLGRVGCGVMGCGDGVVCGDSLWYVMWCNDEIGLMCYVEVNESCDNKLIKSVKVIVVETLSPLSIHKTIGLAIFIALFVHLIKLIHGVGDNMTWLNLEM